jgi:hypothetical protein
VGLDVRHGLWQPDGTPRVGRILDRELGPSRCDRRVIERELVQRAREHVDERVDRPAFERVREHAQQQVLEHLDVRKRERLHVESCRLGHRRGRRRMRSRRHLRAPALPSHGSDVGDVRPGGPRLFIPG